MVGLLLCACFAADAPRPNVLLILADDLGFSDLGCYGGEIETPNLDRLASDGLRYTQFTNTARCWPTRAALLTGYYAQSVRRDKAPGIRGGGGNRNPRPAWAPLLPELLKPAGYRSYVAGKWHLDGKPFDAGQGFSGGMSIGGQNNFFRIKASAGRLPESAGDGTNVYGTQVIAQAAIEALEGHFEEHADAPFFQYLAFTAPHFPLHAEAEDIAKYEGRYDAGWDAVRRRRFERQRELGLLDTSLSETESDVGPPYDFPDAFDILGPGELNRPLPWDEVTPEQKRFQAGKMEVHAAMVDRMDREIGRVLDTIRDAGELDDTLVLFLSDNGASAEIMVRGDGHDPAAPMGSAETYLCLGPGWSTCSNTPFRRHKTWVHEGGISTPLVACWPAGIDARGETRTTPGHVVDVVPTVLELAGVEPPESFADAERPTPPGRSLVPSFASDRRIEREPLWWLHEGNRAVRVGDWKLVAAEGDRWELYDLAADRTEQTDLAAKMPGKVEELAAVWEAGLKDRIDRANRDRN